MFNDIDIKKEYENATKYASINSKNIKNSTTNILLILNLLFLGVVSFLGYDYINSNSKYKTEVMGVTYIPKPTITSESDIKYIREIEQLDDIPNAKEYSDRQLVEYMNKEIEEAYANIEKRAKKD